MNKSSIGICYIGGLEKDGKTPKDTRTPQQKESLLLLIKTLNKIYPEATLHGHNEFSNKACPSFDVQSQYKNI
jgi:N-acetylmuramoyl-L-alanine amidase